MWMVPFDDITEVLHVSIKPRTIADHDANMSIQIYYWDEIVYLLIIPLTKISILCFYLRIFPRREFKYWVYALIGANLVYLIVFEAITIFQCTPVEGAWLHWNKSEFEGTCRNVNLQAWIAAAFCLVLDVVTLALPLPELWRLSMSWKKKLQVIFMFLLGFL
jgi:hypothetical protein